MVKSAAGEALSIAALQWRTALQFYGDRRTRTPILIIWVASFGGALHASVTTFFYLELGATEIQIGLLGFIMSAGSLLLSPFFGWLLDRRGAFPPIALTAGACAVGCLVRGAATGLRTLLLGKPRPRFRCPPHSNPCTRIQAARVACEGAGLFGAASPAAALPATTFAWVFVRHNIRLHYFFVSRFRGGLPGRGG